jgi:phosphate transport system permease protein
MSAMTTNVITESSPRSRLDEHAIFVALSRAKSNVMFSVSVLFTLVILLLLVLVTGYLLNIGFSSLHWTFFTEKLIPQGMVGAPGGMRPALEGTCILIGLASIVGIPVGMLCGIYLSEYSANSILATPTRFVADVLTGVPSIVVGVLGYQLVVVPMGGHSGYAGALALAFIMIPLVARTTEEMLLLVPRSYREASIALGATKARTILTVVLPAATGSIITGVMLAVARIAGETAPLLFTALGANLLPHNGNPSQPFPALTLDIFKYATGPDPAQKQLAWAGILILILLIFALNVMVRLFIGTISKQPRH